MEIHYSKHFCTNRNHWAFQKNLYVRLWNLFYTYPNITKLQNTEQITTLETVLLILEKGIKIGSNKSMIIGTGPKNGRDYLA